MLRVDLNCDMGESGELFPYDLMKDLRLLELVSSANIACGGHAGDAQTMQRLVSRALELDVAIGAHPGYADRENFGRRYVPMSDEEVYNMVWQQCSALLNILQSQGKTLHHVKPHGALYNAAARDPLLANAICRAVAALSPGIQFYGLSGSCMKDAAESAGLVFVSEVFADRTYQDDGSLTSRDLPGALHDSSSKALKQVLEMVIHQAVETVSGRMIWLQADTVCLHGDGADAVEFAEQIRSGLEHHKVRISAPESHS